MPDKVLLLDPQDNVLVALATLDLGAEIKLGPPSNFSCIVSQTIPAKHKVALVDFAPGDLVRMYGMVVGEAVSLSVVAACSRRRTSSTAPAHTPPRASPLPTPYPIPYPGPAAPLWAITAPTAR